MFVEGQSDDECIYDNIIIIVIDQGHLTLKITDVALESFSLLHHDCEEMIVVLLLLSSGILVKEVTADLLKILERPRWE